MKLLAIAVTYNPDLILFKKSLESYLPWVDKCLIWQNSDEELDILMDGLDCGKIEYAGDKTNKGISTALNYAWKYASEHGYNYILTMDQDSVFTDFSKYKNFAESIFKKDVCILGPWYYTPIHDISPDAILERNQIITSGMIVPICILDNIKGYCADFSVDGIDIDLCVKASMAGFKIFQSQAHILEQRFGTQYKEKVLGRTFSGPGYSPKRLYGIFRNYTIIYRKYGHPEFVRKWIHWYLRNFIPNIIFAETDKMSKLIAICRGLVDGCLFKTDK